MSAKVIKSLLVGIGFDLDKKSMGDVDSGLNAIISKATKLGAVVAGAFGIKALTSDFAAAKDMLGKFADVNSVAAHDVLALGNALQSEGGSLQAFMGILENINRVRDRLRMGEAGIFEEAGKAGFDVSEFMSAKDATQAYLSIANQFKNLDAPGQRNVRDALGLDDASVRLLSQGRPAVESQMAEWGNIRPITDEMTKAAAEFNTNMHKLNENIGGFADIIGNEMTRAAANSASWLNSLIEENRPEIRSFFEKEANSIAFFSDLVSGKNVGHYSVGGTRIDEIDDWLKSVTPNESNNYFMPDFGSFYRSAAPYIPDIKSVKSGGFGAPLVPKITIPIILDGRTIEEKIIDVNGRINQQTINDISNSAEGG